MGVLAVFMCVWVGRDAQKWWERQMGNNLRVQLLNANDWQDPLRKPTKPHENIFFPDFLKNYISDLITT